MVWRLIRKQKKTILLLGVFLVMTAGTTALFLTGCAGLQKNPRAVAAPAGTAVVSAAGIWLRGDFHSHSTCSDGDADVDEVVRHAEETGLDFFVITDHDRDMPGETLHWNDPAYTSESLILLYGVEWTSRMGHGNILSHAPFDYTPYWSANLSNDAAGAMELAAAEENAGRSEVLFSVNHPRTPCCSWKYDVFSSVLEIWNGPFSLPSKNGKVLADVWDTLLISGKKVTGIGGSDNHHISGYQRNYNPHGYPTSWVFVRPAEGENPAGRDILSAVEDGRVSLSYRPDADRLEFYADADGDGSFEYMTGDTLPLSETPVRFMVRVVPAHGADKKWHRKQYDLRIIKNGEVIAEDYLHRRRRQSMVFTDIPGEPSFYRVELHGQVREGLLQSIVMGDTLAVSNPIYAGY